MNFPFFQKLREKEALRAWLFFYCFFLVLFFQFPLKGELPGNIDTVLAISLANILGEKIRLLFNLLPTFTALYPAHDPIAFGENCYGHGLVFLIIKLFCSDDIYRYYLYITFIFSLNATSFFCLARHFVDHKPIALLTGLMFASSAFIFSNMDDPNVILLFFPIMSFRYLLAGIRNKNEKLLGRGLILSAVQIWFGAYVFFFQAIAIVVFAITFQKSLRSTCTTKKIITYMLTSLAIVTPLVVLYFYNYYFLEIVSPFGTHEKVFELKSFALHNFWNVLPNNLLYSDSNNLYGEQASFYWTESRKLAFPGVTLALIGIFGVVSTLTQKKLTHDRLFLILVFIIFTALSFGTNLPYGEYFSHIPIISYVRVPSRFYLFSVIVEFVFFAIGLQNLVRLKTFSKPCIRKVFLFSLSVFFIIENAPFPFRGYRYEGLLKPSSTYVDFFKDKPDRNIVLDLPSRMYFFEGERFDSKAPLSFFTRELLYMNWASYHHQIILGGGNGYYPKSRSDIEPAIQALPGINSIRQFNRLGVRYFVFHKKFLLDPQDHILSALLSSPNLILRQDNEDEAIFEINL